MTATSKRSLISLYNTLSRASHSNKVLQSPYICQPCRRQLHRSVKASPIPDPTPFVPDVATFLTLIGRGLSQHASKFQNDWNKLFTLSSQQLKSLGIESVESRRYLLRWLAKFRNGDFGPGGDFEHVTDGKAELRVVEVPTMRNAVKPVSGDGSKRIISTSSTPGMTKLVLNVPVGSPGIVAFKSILKPGQKAADLRKPKKYKLYHGHTIQGPYALPTKGSTGIGAVVQVKEGMWEDRQGQKVFGGERRRAETLHKMAVAEHRKNVR